MAMATAVPAMAMMIPTSFPLLRPWSTARLNGRRHVCIPRATLPLDAGFIGSARRDGWDDVKVNLVDRKDSKEKEVAKEKKGGSRKKEVAPKDTNPSKGVIVQATSKGRGGKTVTVVSGLALGLEETESLLKRLKSLLATGGSIKNGTIEIQGNHSAKIVEELIKQGFQAKKSGK